MCVLLAVYSVSMVGLRISDKILKEKSEEQQTEEKTKENYLLFIEFFISIIDSIVDDWAAVELLTVDEK